MPAERCLIGRLEAAVTISDLLASAYDAFELILTVIRRHDQPGSEYFVPMVMAGAAAGAGRDCLLLAPSLGPRLVAPDSAELPPTSQAEAVRLLDAMSRLLAARLHEVAGPSSPAPDRAACLRAAARAREITRVVSRGQ